MRAGRVPVKLNVVLPVAGFGSAACHVTVPAKGDVMGREARVGLLLGASACLLAVMVDWVIEELQRENPSSQRRS